MKTVYKILFLTLKVCFVVSCQNDASNVDYPEFKKQMVVHCFLSSSQSKIVALVSYNQEIYGRFDANYINKPDLSGVKAYLTDGDNEKEFYFKNDSFFIDAAQFPIIDGHKYTLKVSDEKTGLEVNAQCEVPVLKSCDITVDTSSTNKLLFDDFTFKHITFKVNLNTSNLPNTYIRIKNLCTIYARSGFDESIQYTHIRDLQVVNAFIKPEMQNFQFEVPYLVIDYFENLDSVFFNMQVYQYNYEYYTYKQSLDNYADEDSYFTEISPVYTNINGGLGFFGGYTVQEFRMKLNKDMVENK